MDRSEKVGLGVAAAGHVVLFGLLSAGFLAAPKPVAIPPQPIEVSMADEVALEASAPQSAVAPDASEAPDLGKPEDAAPPPPAESAPEPTPPAPAPKPAPKPVEKAKPVEAKPVPKVVPVAKPAEAKPKPKPAPAPKETAKPEPKKPAPAKPAPAKSAPAEAKPAATPAKPSRTVGNGTKPGSTAARPRGNQLGDHFLDFIGDKPTKTQSNAPVAVKLDARALSGIQSAIARQIQPCADRQVDPGPGANEIVSVLNLRLNKDGTLAATPSMIRQTGVNDDNSRYARRVVDLGIAALKGCSPLKLPPEFYQTPSGGWSNINYNWKLR